MFNNETIGFSDEQIFVLLQGLTALEGAVRAINQPLPDQFNELKGKLNFELNTHSKFKHSTLTTEQVAQILRCTGKRVHQLASNGLIKIAHEGKRGRGYSTLYYSDSIKDYLAKKSRRL